MNHNQGIFQLKKEEYEVMSKELTKTFLKLELSFYLKHTKNLQKTPTGQFFWWKLFLKSPALTALTVFC